MNARQTNGQAAPGRQVTSGLAREDLLEVIERHRPMAEAGDAGVSKMPSSWMFDGMDHSRARRAAVLILFGRLDDIDATAAPLTAPADLDVLFVERATTLRNHPGQVAFPGGAIDDTDSSSRAAALREAEEETGLDPEGVEILGQLPPAELPVTNFVVTPVLGWWKLPCEVFAVDQGESASVFRAPVADLVDPRNRLSIEVSRRGQQHRSPAFDLQGRLIWGFTGIVLSRLLDDLGWSLPWDPSRTRPHPFS
ncbi:MAG: NUDIX hydrolase [Arthrobacter sp.]|uniref:NUDIX hydrolase n=1 Tax=Arthrobacter sp. AOP36-A1-22 TaxID=3457684 RepID=UPI0026557377|nr:CoA pyrophosphatase [Micrococcaceae bacterium]MDN5880195.1 CoA pyrophosphatase [Micrococcaceae bacterium]MDN6170777.1 CoA pyrophosphatase [Micrococcaceae bacterium]MDN6178444.1 CoA pyrophosphatase [Micrococcaceae bacterium]MDN6202198.1 CoA pyrophosphatase [Micrococcaceae bacterium]